MMKQPHPRRFLAKWLGISLGSATLVLVVMLGSMVAGLFWLATNHSRNAPLDLTPYLPRLQAFLAEQGLNISVSHLELYYDDAPVLRAEGLQVLGPDGNLAVFGEAAAIKLAKGRLLQLALSPKIIEARNVTLRLVRTPSGVVTIAGFPVGGTASAKPDRGLVEWLENLPGDSLWGRLKQVRVDGLTVLLRDQIQNTEWVLEDGRLSLDRYDDSGERGSLLAQIRRLTGPQLNVPKGVSGKPIPVLVSLERTVGAEQVSVEAKFGQLNAAIIGDYLPPQIQDFVTGQGTLSVGSVLTRGNILGEPWLTVKLNKAQLNLPAAAGFSKPIALPRLEATVSFQPAPLDTLWVKNLMLTGPRGNLFVISGSVLNLSTSPTLNLTGFSPGGDAQAIFDFFPDANPKLQKTLTFLRNDLRDARYKNLVAKVGLNLKAFPGCANACGPMTIDAEVVGGEVQYIDELPPAIITSSSQPARFYWRGQQLAVIAPAAKVGNQQARSVWVNVNNIFSPSPTLVQVSGTLSGEVQDVIERLNAIPEVRGRIPGSYSGTHQSILNVQVPLVRKISPTFASSTVVVRGVVSKPTVTGLPVVGSSTLAAPTALVVLDASKTFTITASQATLLGGQLGLQWQQNLQPKQPSAMSLILSGTLPGSWLQQQVGKENLEASGAIRLNAKLNETTSGTWAFQGAANGQGLVLNLPSANYRKAAGLPLQMNATGRYQVTPATLTLSGLRITGHQADVSGSLSLPLATPERGTVRLPNLRLGDTAASIVLNNGTLQLRGQTLDLRGLDLENPGNQRQLADLQLDAQLNTLLFGEGALRQATLQAASRNGRWQLQRMNGLVENGGRIAINRQGNRLSINVPNLGRTLEVFGLYDKLKGGALFGTLTYRNASTASGELKLNDFELKNPPTMMKILGLLSLEQLVAGTDTTKFSSGKVPLTLTDDAFTLSNAHFSGPSMDLRLDGRYLRGTSRLDFNGSLAPAIPFNRMVAKIPLLGTILTGSQDGVVVADFRLNGPSSDPQVSVKPLSILTPGLLKDLFRGGTNNSPAEQPKERPR